MLCWTQQCKVLVLYILRSVLSMVCGSLALPSFAHSVIAKAINTFAGTDRTCAALKEIVLHYGQSCCFTLWRLQIVHRMFVIAILSTLSAGFHNWLFMSAAGQLTSVLRTKFFKSILRQDSQYSLLSCLYRR